MSRVKMTTGCARHSCAETVLGGGDSPPIQAPNSQAWGGRLACAWAGGGASSAMVTIRQAMRRMQATSVGSSGTIGRVGISDQWWRADGGARNRAHAAPPVYAHARAG